jgi:hypothetical protein
VSQAAARSSEAPADDGVRDAYACRPLAVLESL